MVVFGIHFLLSLIRTATMGAAYVTGLQSGRRRNASTTAVGRMAATCKHFAAFGSPSGGLYVYQSRVEFSRCSHSVTQKSRSGRRWRKGASNYLSPGIPKSMRGCRCNEHHDRLFKFRRSSRREQRSYVHSIPNRRHLTSFVYRSPEGHCAIRSSHSSCSV